MNKVKEYKVKNMTYIEAIQKLLESIDEELSLPIHIVFYFYNANYINLKIEADIKKKSIDEVLCYQIPNYEHFSIVWNDNNDVCFRSWHHLTKLKSDNSSIESHLEPYKHISTTKDGKYNIFLALLPDEKKRERDGVRYIEYLVEDDTKYEFNEVVLPTFSEYRYQNLYKYTEENEFLNAILIEFIVRNATYNNLLPNSYTCELESLEYESDEEFEIRAEMNFRDQEKKIDNTLRKNYGLGYEEISALAKTYNHSYADVLQESQISQLIKYPQAPIQKIELNFELSEEEILQRVKSHKRDFDDEQAMLFNYKTKIKGEYLEKALEVIKKFPSQSFKKCQNSIITAIYVYDYVQAAKLNINKLNQLIQDEYKAKREKIEVSYKQLQTSKDKQIKDLLKPNKDVEHLKKEKENLLKEQEQAFEKHKKELRRELHRNPKVKIDENNDSIYHEVAYVLEAQAGQMKKIHDYIKNFMEKKIL